jgi:hypothetical protein
MLNFFDLDFVKKQFCRYKCTADGDTAICENCQIDNFIQELKGYDKLDIK